MFRIFAVLCAGSTLLSLDAATLYTGSSGSTIIPLSTKTFQRDRLIPTAAADTFTLAADGETLYTAIYATVTFSGQLQFPGYVTMASLTTGKTLRRYTTKYPIWPQPYTPVTVAVAPNQSQIYVATCSGWVNYYDGNYCRAGNVEVIDAATGVNLAVISMESDTVVQVVASPDGNTVYAVHAYEFAPECVHQPSAIPENAVTAIDVASLQAGASFAAEAIYGEYPTGMALTPDGATAFVLTNSYGYGVSVYRVNTPQMTLAATIIPPGNLYGSATMALSPTGKTLAVELYNELMLIDTTTGTITQTFQNVIGNVLFTGPDGAVYIVNYQDLNLLNTQTGMISTVATQQTFLAVIPSRDVSEIYVFGRSAVEGLAEGATTPSMVYNTGGAVNWLAVSPDGHTLYSAWRDGGVWVNDTASGVTIGKFLEDENNIGAIAVSTDGETLYAVTYNNPATLIFANALTGAVEKTISIPGCTSWDTAAIAVAPGGDRVYTMVCGPVGVVDTKTQSVVAQVAGTNGGALAVSPNGKTLYASAGTGWYDCDLTGIDVIDTATYQVVGIIPFGAGAMAVSPDGRTIYAQGCQGATQGLAIIDTTTLAVTHFVPLPGPGTPGELVAVTPDGRYVYYWNGTFLDIQTLQFSKFQGGGAIAIH